MSIEQSIRTMLIALIPNQKLTDDKIVFMNTNQLEAYPQLTYEVLSVNYTTIGTNTTDDPIERVANVEFTIITKEALEAADLKDTLEDVLRSDDILDEWDNLIYTAVIHLNSNFITTTEGSGDEKEPYMTVIQAEIYFKKDT